MIIRTEVTHIHQNTNTEHLVFMYQTSVYVVIKSRTNEEIYYAIKHKFKTFDEARGFKRGYITAYTQFSLEITSVFMENMEIDGFTETEH